LVHGIVVDDGAVVNVCPLGEEPEGDISLGDIPEEFEGWVVGVLDGIVVGLPDCDGGEEVGIVDDGMPGICDVDPG